MRVKVYNEAGEEVWDMGSDLRLFQMPVGLTVLQGVAAPEAPQAAVILLQGPGLSVSWDGRSSAGQPVDSGSYYMVVRSVDAFSTATTLTVALSVIRAQSGVDIAIYNSAGELVRTHGSASTGNGSLRLDKEEFAPEGGGGTGVEVRWGTGAGEAWVWDGRNAAGQAVASGTYTVQIVRHEEGKTTGSQTVAVAVLALPGSDWLGGALAAPNPARGGASIVRFIAPQLPSGARFSVDIYNVAGERVCSFTGDRPDLAWDLSARPVAGGIYLARLRADGLDGRAQVKTIKLAVAR